MRIQLFRWRHARGLVALAVVIASLTMGALVTWGAPGAQEDALPPQVFDTQPLIGEELALDGAVTFYFDQAMDPDAVADAFSVTPDVAGSLRWDDAQTLVFVPDEAYERATAYTFNIGTEAVSAEGVSLEMPFALTLRTIGYLEVSQVLPEDGLQAVDTDSVITVIFNRPVVPLVVAEEMDTLPDPLEFDPPVAGSGEWINTSIYLYTPDEELNGGTRYTVTVPAGLEDITGGVLKDDFSWSFSTVRPDIVSISPRAGQENVALNQNIVVLFTQAMDPEAVQNAISVEQSPLLPEEADWQPVNGSFRWNDSQRRVTFVPDEPFALESVVRVAINRTEALSVTGAQLMESLVMQFSTVPYPGIRGTLPVDGDLEASPYGGFTITFKSPMDRDSLEDKVLIEPEPWREFDSYYYDYDNSYTLSFDTEPSTQYTITILPGMADKYGNTIDEGRVITYVTGPYEPQVSLQAPGDVGLYSAYNNTTRVFATHRNVSELDLGLWSVPLVNLADLTGPDRWDAWENYTPRPQDLLRQWTIPVSSQQDAMRYELLYVSQSGASGISNIQCLGAPEAQVTIGDVAIVTDDDARPLNVRQEPNLTAPVITQALPGETFQIVAGPFCEGGYLWWQIRLDNEIVGWAAEGSAEVYFYAPLGEAPSDPNAPEVEVGEEEAPPPLAPGAYVLQLQAPEVQMRGTSPNRQVMLVSTVNITLKFSQDTALAWVTDLDSGAPVANVPVIFYNQEFNPIGRVETDADGLAVAEIPHLEDLYTYVYATVRTDEHFGFVSSWLSDGLDPWQFDVPSDYEPEDFAVYLYTDRPIYRPDQPVYFKGILRNRDDVAYSLPAMDEVPVEIYDDRGEMIYQETLPVNAQGSFSGELKLDVEAPLGYYRIVANVTSNMRDQFGISFSVAEYRAPEFQVNVTPAADQVVQGDTIEVLVDSRYFFGGAVSDATVRYSVLAQDYTFSYDGPGYWSFVDRNYDFYAPDYYGPYGEQIADGEAKTDAMGRFLIELDADLGDRVSSQTFTIEASVTDESDQLVAGRAQVIVHQGEVYVGLQPENYVGQAERENAVNVIAVDWYSEAKAGQEIAYEVVERRWFSVQEEDELGRTIWTWDVKETPVEDASGTVTTDAEGKAQIVFTPPFGGVYKVYARTTDALGNEVTSSAFMWVSGSDYVNWRQENSNRIQLITDNDHYSVGDTAEVLIPSPWQGEAYALITVERGDILTREVLKLETNSTIYRLPIEASYAPNVFVNVVLMKGVDENNPTAAFRMGIAPINVETDQLVMDLDVASNVDAAAGEFAGPGDTVQYTITARDYVGTPVPNAEIGVGLTDLAVLSIADANSPDLLPFFYSERGITVRTAMPLTVSVDQATQVIIDTIKGGGGGYGEGGLFDVRQEFVDTPLWAPSLVTDENGQVTVDVTLPDNLTTWRLDVRGVTTGEAGPMLVGQTTYDLLSTKPVLVRPLTPRFFIVEDKATLGAIVNNNTDEDLLTEIMLEGTGFVVDEGVELTQMVNIPAQGSGRVNWPVTVLDVSQINATFYANANDGAYTDASKPPLGQGEDRTLPVYRYEVPETVGTAGTIYGPEAGSRTESIALPRSWDVTQGELTVRVDRSLAAATVDGLEWLRNYPYYCIEQIISRFLPSAVTVRALADLGLDDPELSAHLETEVNYALQRLYAQQKVDGGWGWFPQDDSNPVVTAYALIGLIEAQQAGFPVNTAVIDNAAGFVTQALRVIQSQDATWRINRQAFLLYALARADRGDLSRTVRLFDERESMSEYAKAYLALTFHMLAPDDARAMELITDLNNSLIVSATGAHWEEGYTDYWNWNTDTRTTALGLMAMVEINPDNPMIPNIVRWLMVSRTADSWETTQETAWAVMALTGWMVESGELYPDYTFDLTLNGDRLPVDDTSATPENVKESEVLTVQVADLLSDTLNRLTFSRTAGDGNLYYTAHLRAFLPVPEVKALNRGIIVSRSYSLLNDPDAGPITEAEVGEPVQVSVTIIAPTDLHYVVIEDPIPAGAQAVDPNLNTSSQVGTQPELNRESPLSRGWGWWWFSNIEMRDEKVVLYATYLPRGTYEFQLRDLSGDGGRVQRDPHDRAGVLLPGGVRSR